MLSLEVSAEPAHPQRHILGTSSEFLDQHILPPRPLLAQGLLLETQGGFDSHAGRKVKYLREYVEATGFQGTLRGDG